MVGHVALQRRDGNVAVFDRAIIGAVFGVGSEVLFANPEVRLAPRIDVFSDHRAGVLNSLASNLDAFDLSERNVDVKQRSFRQSLGQNLSGGKLRESRGFSEIKVVARNQTYRDARYAEDRRLQRSRDRSGVGRIVAEIP